MIVLWLSPRIQPETLNREPQFPKPHGTCEACPLVSDCSSPSRAWPSPLVSVSAFSTDLVAVVPTPPRPGQNPFQHSPAGLCIMPCLHSPSPPGEGQRLLPLWTPFPSSFPAPWALPSSFASSTSSSLMGCSVSIVPSLVPTEKGACAWR